MITALIYILIVGLICYLIYFIAGKFISGTPLQIIGIIIGLLFLLYALKMLGVLNL